mgnify:CR=1 FL=1
MKVFLPKEKQDSLVQMNLIHSESGQSLAEFILTFGIVCLVIILFVKLAFNFTKGYMVHYANFMASRSYMVQDNNSANPLTTDGDAKRIALRLVYKNILGSIDQSNITVLDPSKVENKVYVGIKTEIVEDFSLSQMIGGKQKVRLISESFLGRTPVISECAIGTCDAMKRITGDDCGGGGTKGFVTLWDNGC